MCLCVYREKNRGIKCLSYYGMPPSAPGLLSLWIGEKRPGIEEDRRPSLGISAPAKLWLLFSSLEQAYAMF